MSAKDIIRILEKYRATVAGYESQLRLDFAALIVQGMEDRDWSQRQLSDACGLKEPFISRVVNGESNCTYQTTAKILHVLGIKPRIVRDTASNEHGYTSAARLMLVPVEGHSYGEEEEHPTIGAYKFESYTNRLARVDTSETHGVAVV